MTTNEQNIRYRQLTDRRIFLLLHSGIGFKKEYLPELEAVNQEMKELRAVIDWEHGKRKKVSHG